MKALPPYKEWTTVQYLMILPAVLLYTVGCALLIHWIADTRNRRNRRRTTYIGVHRVRNTK